MQFVYRLSSQMGKTVAANGATMAGYQVRLETPRSLNADVEIC